MTISFRAEIYEHLNLSNNCLIIDGDERGDSVGTVQVTHLRDNLVFSSYAHFSY